MKYVDLSPKMSLQPAEVELTTPYVAGELPLGQSAGGLQMFSNVFKRGYGDNVFGVDGNGMWLGAADFKNGHFKADYQGRVYLTTEDGSLVIDTVNKQILVFEGDIAVGLFGIQPGGF